MSSTLQIDLISVPQTETAGSRSAARFAYQRNWALAELVEYHLQEKDYVFAFEYHDDILILNSKDNPTDLQFIQVKTKTTGEKWTIHELTKSESGKKGNPAKLSIIGKLYKNKKNFHSYSSKLRFVTNAYFSFADPAPITCGNQFKETDQAKIISAVQAQLGTDHVDLSNLQIEKSSLSVEDHEKHIRGILNNFFEELLGEDHCIPITPWYQSISDQIKLKNNFPSEQVESFDELIRNKCITRPEIENFVQQASQSRNGGANWDLIKAQLMANGLSFQEILKLQRSWQQYTSDRLDYDNNALKNLESDISHALSAASLGANPTLKDVISTIRSATSTKLSKVASIFDQYYIDTIILWLYCEQI